MVCYSIFWSGQLEPYDYQINYANINLRHQYGIFVA